MHAFYLPAGCRMKITASMEEPAVSRHRLTVGIFTVGNTEEPRATYGSRIGAGETQRIDAPPLKVASICRVASEHEVGRNWDSDACEVLADRPADVALRFGRSAADSAVDAADACVLGFEFSPERTADRADVAAGRADEF